MAQNDQNKNPNDLETDILGDIDPIQTDRTDRPSSGSTPGASGIADEDKDDVSGLRRDSERREQPDPQRNPRTGPIG